MSPKVLFTASTYSHIYHFHRPYLREFAARGWEVHIACGGAGYDIPEAHRMIDIPFEKSMTSRKNLAATQKLRRILSQERYDLVSCHTSLAAFFTRLAVMSLRERPLTVNTAHGYLFDERTRGAKRALLLGAERLTSGVTDVLMTMNAWDTSLARRERLGRHIVEIPGMGVDFSRLFLTDEASARHTLRTEWGFSDTDYLLVYAAEFSARKDQKTLLHALPLLPERVGLLLPGNGTEREACIALAKELGVAHRVAFPGQTRDMAPWYAAADAACSSSRSEGLPFNIMEAMYCALPVVATEVKGHTDLIGNGETGLLFPFGNVSRCAEQIARLAAEPALARQLGRAAHERALSYSLDCVLPQVMSVYEDALGPELLPYIDIAPALR